LANADVGLALLLNAVLGLAYRPTNHRRNDSNGKPASLEHTSKPTPSNLARQCAVTWTAGESYTKRQLFLALIVQRRGKGAVHDGARHALLRELLAQSSPAGRSQSGSASNPRLRKSLVIHQPCVSEFRQHAGDDILGNASPPQPGNKLSTTAHPDAQQSECYLLGP